MDTSNEVITISVGQAGTQILSACWELFCLEHGIGPDGCLRSRYGPPDNVFYTFFAPSQTGLFTPRTMMFDLEPDMMNQIRAGMQRNLFSSDSLIAGKEGAANNYGKGYKLGRETIDVAMNCIRRMSENCSNLHGFIIFRALGGGTGSGFTTLLLEQLENNYKKIPIIDCAIYPMPFVSSATVEPYNSILAIYNGLDYRSCCFVLDNDALYNICTSKLKVENPMYCNINRLLAQVISNITTPMRFGNGMNSNFQKICVNLIPCPKVHFLLVAYSPLITPKQKQNPTVTEITFDCFTHQNQMAICHPEQGVYTSCYLFYRGGIQAFEIYQAIESLQPRLPIPLADWSPTVCKLAINEHQPITVSGGDLGLPKFSVACLSNSTAVKDIFNNLASKFDLMYKKRTFVHHYLAENVEEDDLKNARASINTICDEYDAITT